jgi:hypothetical protein
MQMDRREFLKKSAFFALFASALKPVSWLAEAWAANFKSPPPAGKNIADPAKGQAKNMKYVHFHAEYAGPKKDQFVKSKSDCANCTQFKPDKAGEAWGKCAMVANAYVYQEGLCQMWIKKPGT